jgi:hypothetical protein
MKTKHQDKIEALRADEEGKAVQRRPKASCYWATKDGWADRKSEDLDWDFECADYRPKPTKKFVPWTRDNVPVGIVVKLKHEEGFKGVILYCFPATCRVGLADPTYQTLFENYEQLDGSPCGTEESNV